MTKTMLLIDADNVSTDVMEQAVDALLQEFGALHVRRAYCTAESALKHQGLFKRLSIRPMVNLSAGKNSTDIALAVDALDLVLSERPDVVAIASSDSDFAPLVGRLREKGCRVIGIGQQGKTGDATQAAYDAFTVMSHRPASTTTRSTSRAAPRPAPARKAAGKRTVAAKTPAAPAVAPDTSAAPTSSAPAKTTRRRSAAAKKASAQTTTDAGTATSAAAPRAASAVPDTVRQILTAMPELVRGDTVELRVAADRLRQAGLLSKSGQSTKVFGAFADRFELVPASNPNRVRLRT